MSNAVDDGNLVDESTFSTAVYSKLAEIQSNPSLTSDEVATCVAILGAAAGSFSYWNENIDDWNVIMQGKGKTPITTQTRGQKVYAFFIDDCRGGSWGGLIGSMLPGVGNVAGAVMGAAIFSGLKAMEWD